MKPTDFSKHLSHFFLSYLPNERGASENTIMSYRDTFMMFLDFLRKVKKEKIEDLNINRLTKELVSEFLGWLQSQKKNSALTVNSRLAAIRSFFKHLQTENVGHLHESQRILSIRPKKAHPRIMSYLTPAGIALLFKQPDLKTQRGRRDLALLALLYDSAARVQEIIDLTPLSLKLNGQFPSVTILGKGSKTRPVLLLHAQIDLLKSYMKEFQLDQPENNMRPLFSNSKGEKLTRAGVTFILKKYIESARKNDELLIPKSISCHSMRHSKAMHLLEADVALEIIQQILGHKLIQTTLVYAKANDKLKKDALEKANLNLTPKVSRRWKEPNVIEFLKKLGKFKK